MSAPLLRWLLVSSSVVLFLLPESADARIAARRAARRAIAANAVPPRTANEVSPAQSDLPSRLLGRRRWRRLQAEQQASRANNNARQADAARRRTEPDAAPPAPPAALPAAADLAALDDTALHGALRDAQWRLNQRLARLETAISWQRYLVMDAQASAPNGGEDQSLRQALTRFDRVAANPSYAKIARLPSFMATQRVLRELVARDKGPQLTAEVDGPKLTADTDDLAANQRGQEVLPTPEPVAESGAPGRERSILKRR